MSEEQEEKAAAAVSAAAAAEYEDASVATAASELSPSHGSSFVARGARRLVLGAHPSSHQRADLSNSKQQPASAAKQSTRNQDTDSAVACTPLAHPAEAKVSRAKRQKMAEDRAREITDHSSQMHRGRVASS